VLVLKKIGMARMLKNEFSSKAIELENSGATVEELRKLLGTKRERLGIFEGDSLEGMMEAGQGSGLIKNIISVKELFAELILDFETKRKELI
jgi:enoyl-[acyl-carrier protein] reductase II